MLLGSRWDREIARLAVPALGALAADPLVSVVDTAFVGRLGAEALAALAVATAVFGIAFALANFLPYGTTPQVAAAVGAGAPGEAGALARGALRIAVAAGLLGLVVMVVFADPILRILGAGPATIHDATSYLQIRALGFPAVMVVLAGHGIFRGHQDTRTPLFVSLGLNAVNLVLDPIFIFGLDGGLAGAAWATVTAQLVGAALFCFLLMGPSRKLLGGDSGAAIAPLMRAGYALLIRTGSLIATLTVATAVAARVGTTELAAHQIAFQVWLFLALAVDALAIAAQALVGKLLSSGDRRDAREVSNRLLVLGVVVGIGIGLLLVGAGIWLPGWFTTDDQVIAALGSVYVFVVVLQPLNAIVFVWDGIAIGVRAFAFTAASMVGSAVVSVSVLAAVLPLGWGLPGVWWGIAALMAVRASSLAFWYLRGQPWFGPDPYPSSPAA